MGDRGLGIWALSLGVGDGGVCMDVIGPRAYEVGCREVLGCSKVLGVRRGVCLRCCGCVVRIPLYV